MANAVANSDTSKTIDAHEAKSSAEKTVQALRECLADDLDTAGALTVIDEWAKETTTVDAAELVASAVDGLLGVRIS